jgi:CRP-like cAMP-binding protein
MSFRLKEAVFKVRCREPGCPFFSDFVVKENLMGATEGDVDSEALKLARNMGFNKHDALYGRKHSMSNPEVWKVSASYDRMGPVPAHMPNGTAPSWTAASAPTRTYRAGEIIIRKGESAATVCEVLRGAAFNVKHQDMPYKAGSTFGAAALFRQKSRLADVVAAQDGTVIAFYNLKELSRTNPVKARALYDEAMEDIFHILVHLEGYATSLERQIAKLKAAAKPAAKRKPAPKGKKAAPKGKARRVAPAKKKPPAKKKVVSKKKR